MGHHHLNLQLWWQRYCVIYDLHEPANCLNLESILNPLHLNHFQRDCWTWRNVHLLLLGALKANYFCVSQEILWAESQRWIPLQDLQSSMIIMIILDRSKPAQAQLVSCEICYYKLRLGVFLLFKADRFSRLILLESSCPKTLQLSWRRDSKLNAKR